MADSHDGVLLHLTKDMKAIGSILSEGRLRAVNAYGAVRRHEVLADSQRVVCLSEIEAENRSRLAERRGAFGVALDMAQAVEGGAAPVWYLPRDTAPQQLLFDLVKAMAYRSKPDPEHPLWRLTPFIDYPGRYEDGGYPRTYDWSWEREWRVRGDLAFRPEDILFVCGPEAEHHNLATMWAQLGLQGAARVVDLQWSVERQQAVLRAGPPVQPVVQRWLRGSDMPASAEMSNQVLREPDGMDSFFGEWNEAPEDPRDTIDDWWSEFHRDD